MNNNKTKNFLGLAFPSSEVILGGIAIVIIVIVIVIMRRSKKTTKLTSSPPILKAVALASSTVTSPTCLVSTDQATVNNIKNQVQTVVSTVNAMSPQPSSDVLNSFNSAVTAINTQITNLLALPTCCSGQNQIYDPTNTACICQSPYGVDTSGNCTVNCTGQNQEYNPVSKTCRCKNPYGLDTNGNCTIACTFPQAIWTGGACACNSGYMLLPSLNSCIVPPNDMVNGTYLPQISTYATTLSALPKNISTSYTAYLPFQILSAIFKSTSSTSKADVTSTFSGYFDANGNVKSNAVATLNNPPYDAMFGDPAAGQSKVLVVQYARNGVQKTVTFSENTPIYSSSLP